MTRSSHALLEPLPDDYVSEEEQSWFKLLYFWMSPLIARCVKVSAQSGSIGISDLPRMPRTEHLDTVYEQTFIPIWQAELKNPRNPAKGPSLSAALIRAFWWEIALGTVFKFIGDTSTVGMPFLLQVQLTWMVDYAINPNGYIGLEYQGYLLSLALGAMVIANAFFQNAAQFYTSKAFSKMRACVMLALYEKATALPGSHGLTGRVSQMHGTDATKFVEASFFVQNLSTAVPMMIAAVIALWFFIGPATFAGLAIAIIVIPIQGALGKKNGMERFAASRYGDRRIQRVNEFVQGIRIIKFMGWESQFEKTTQQARDGEIKHLFEMHKSRAAFFAVMSYAPVLMSFTTFAVAYALGNSMEAQNIFPAFAMLSVLRAPMAIMPLAAMKVIELFVVMRRVSEFLSLPDPVSYIEVVDCIEGHQDSAVYIPQVIIQYDSNLAPANTSSLGPKSPGNGNPPSVQGQGNGGASGSGKRRRSKLETDPGALLREKKLVTLMEVRDLDIPKGQLTIVIGATASGKSVLISTIVGETIVSSDSKVIRSGSLAYVAQEAWIMNETLRNNVTMGLPLDDTKYKEALLACQLKADLEQLPASDETEIGERGINLSGGQKQRVAFARAVYSGRDIVLMDDPLSAVDPQVCGALFHGCIRGAMKGRTRVLVTHQQQFLRWADRVIIVAGLEIVFNGTYDELMLDAKLKEHIAAASRRAAIVNVKDGQDAAALEEAIKAQEAALEKELRDADVLATRDVTTEASAWTILASPAGSSRNKGADAPSDPNKGKALITTENVKFREGIFIYLWYCGMGGWRIVGTMWFLYLVWRVVYGFSDYMITWWTSRAAPFHRYNLTQNQYLYWYAILVGGVFIFAVIRLIPFVLAAISASRAVHSKIVKRLLKCPMSFYDTTPAGRILNRVGKDVEVMDISIPELLQPFYNLTLTILGVWVVQAIAAWFMPLVYLFVIIIFIYFFHEYVLTNHDIKALDSAMRSPALSIMNETLGGLATLRAFDMVDKYRRTHAQRLTLMTIATYSWRNLQRWLGLRVGFLSGILTLTLGMIIEGMMQNEDDQQRLSGLPSMSLALTYVVMTSSALGFLTTTLADVMAQFSSVERLKEYAETLPQERDITYTDCGVVKLDENNVAIEAPPPPEDWPSRGSIEFDHVFLRYRPGLDLVLKDVSFTVNGGEKVGIVGRTGSGKSTVMLSLFRMVETAHDTHPIANRILIDGVDISHVRLEDLRKNVTIIPQDPLLFQGTVRSNLDPFDLHTDEQIWVVLRKAKLTERVEREENGLACPVADRGANFSAGERQLLCLARALLKDCLILLLDEATASIDPKHDQIVQETIRREFADRTVLTIAHRLATVIDSDKVLVLDNGCALEFGSPHELLQNPTGGFTSMVRELGIEEEARLRGIAAQHHNRNAASAPF